MRADDRTADGLTTDDLVEPRGRHEGEQQPGGMRPAGERRPQKSPDEDPQRAGLRSHGQEQAAPTTAAPTGRTMAAQAATSQGVTDETVTARPADAEERVGLLRPEQVTEFPSRWRDVQTAFDHDPQRTLRDADQLVAEVRRALASAFADHKHALEAQWQQSGEVATEDPRQAPRRYRTFFDELLRS